MKKLTLLLPLVLLTLFLLNLTSAVSDPTELFQQQIGTDQKIPTPEEIKEQIREKYLKQEWSNTIAKIPIIGKVHDFFLAHPLPFKILFNYPYEISFIFFLIVILWVYISAISSDFLRGSEIVTGAIPFLIGILIAIILAQTNLIKIIVLFVLDLIFARETLWMKLLLGLLIFILLTMIYVYKKYLVRRIKKERGERKLKEATTRIEEAAAALAAEVKRKSKEEAQYPGLIVKRAQNIT